MFNFSRYNYIRHCSNQWDC